MEYVRICGASKIRNAIRDVRNGACMQKIKHVLPRAQWTAVVLQMVLILIVGKIHCFAFGCVPF